MKRSKGINSFKKRRKNSRKYSKKRKSYKKRKYSKRRRNQRGGALAVPGDYTVTNTFAISGNIGDSPIANTTEVLSFEVDDEFRITAKSGPFVSLEMTVGREGDRWALKETLEGEKSKFRVT